MGAISLACVLPVLTGTALPADEPAHKPPGQRLLRAEEARKAEEQEKQLDELQEAGKFAEALKVAEGLVELRGQAQGADHWQAADARGQVEALRRVLQRGPEDRDAYARSFTLQRQAVALVAKGRYREAQPVLEKVLAIKRQVLGDEDPLTATSYNEVAANLNRQGMYAEAEAGLRTALAIRRQALGEEHPDTAESYSWVAANLNAQVRYAEAEAGYRTALAIYRKVLGEEHPDTATAYGNVAGNLAAQGQYAEAEACDRKALAIRRQVLGEGHTRTATSYNNLALNLKVQGRYAEAEAGYRKALTIFRKALGEEHPDTAACCNNLAANLHAQGKYAEAEAGYRTALDIDRQALGEDHPDTATTYNNLAGNLSAQGKYAEAEVVYRKALAIWRRALGEQHPLTATGYHNLASNLDAQGKVAEAEAGFRKALDIGRKVLGEGHPDTAASYHSLAVNLSRQGKYAEAEVGYRKALDVFRKIYGEGHPRTTRCYSNVAGSLYDQGRYAEAEAGFRKALAIYRKVLGEDHPDTAGGYHVLAHNLHAQGKYSEAEANWQEAADRFARARLRQAASGLERATGTGAHSPLPYLAAVLARNGKPEAAWRRFEEGLALGTWDDLSARLRRPPAEQARQTDLVNRLNRLDQLVEHTLAAQEPTAEQKKRREDLLSQHRQVRQELDAFARHLEQAYGPAAGQVFDRAQIQATLPADVALVGWLDLPGNPKAADRDGEHWAVVLRSAGGPAWIRLRGSGPNSAWTGADTRLPFELRAALQTPRAAWRPLAHRLRRQRLEPLAPHLAAADGLPAVRHLVVLPSNLLPALPVEVFADGYTVSYALSGTVYAHLRRQPRPDTRGLLALADPVFEPPAGADKPLPLPPGGALLTTVVPGSNAAQAGLKPNDVLLRYNGTDLAGPADLKVLPESEGATRPVSLTVWRDGKTLTRQVRPGKLGVVLASEPAPRALAEQHKLDRRLASAARGGDEKWDPLPGTRAEVEALRRLFGPGDPAPKLLLDSDASEQQLDDLANGPELGTYRYVHLATHGVVDEGFPLRSAVILSRDRLPDPQKQLEAGRPAYDGRLTAEEVLRHWHLKSELVTLSACQTALGKYEHSEGHVGFAQALLLAGSRSVCLSQWKVDDAATALLMQRFYQNLLGRRDGLQAPLPKAQALAEAKAWLRGLSRDEALKQAARLTQGVERGKNRPVLPLLPPVPPAPAGATEGRPYAHPYYWAAFVLIGDPD
jgi:tetratricopeptide (TPR) repeat protein